MTVQDPAAGSPPELIALLRDGSVLIPQDAAVFEMIAKWRNAPTNTATAEIKKVEPTLEKSRGEGG